jgi:hypothetical protein
MNANVCREMTLRDVAKAAGVSMSTVSSAGEMIVQKAHEEVDIVTLQNTSEGAMQRTMVKVHPQLVEVRGKYDADGSDPPSDQAPSPGTLHLRLPSM